jgi:hypothetical protein
MKDPAQGGSFAFVSYEGSALPKDPKVRDLIRRRAMGHNAAIRRRNGGYGKHNVRQSPAWLQENKTPTEKPKSDAAVNIYEDLFHGSEDDATIENRVAEMSMTVSVYSDKFPGASWSTSLTYAPGDIFVSTLCGNFSILYLAAPLTVLHLGMNTLSYFKSDLGRIGRTLTKIPVNLESRRLLAFIPSRYGRVSAITHATDCLVARLGQIVHTGGRSHAEGNLCALKSYSRALKSLQDAIDDEDLRTTPETLCAAELLGFYEVCSVFIIS